MAARSAIPAVFTSYCRIGILWELIGMDGMRDQPMVWLVAR
jgi:hypothetical protein